MGNLVRRILGRLAGILWRRGPDRARSIEVMEERLRMGRCLECNGPSAISMYCRKCSISSVR